MKIQYLYMVFGSYLTVFDHRFVTFLNFFFTSALHST